MALPNGIELYIDRELGANAYKISVYKHKMFVGWLIGYINHMNKTIACYPFRQSKSCARSEMHMRGNGARNGARQMKVYEIMALLAEHPAGAEVEVTRHMFFEEFSALPNEDIGRQVGGKANEIFEEDGTVYIAL